MNQSVSQFEEIVRNYEGIHLGVGPVSRNCVDAAIDVARSRNIPISLIASRRQVDMAELGGGYVNDWDTVGFAAYVRDRANGAPVFLARDHGGPWQSEEECARGYDTTQAMESAKRSYEVDILAGFELLHLDPFRADPVGGDLTLDRFLERTKDLYTHCFEFARRNGRDVSFEIATDEGSIGEAEGHETESFIREMLNFCTREDLPPPLFAVLLTGTKVMETRNVGPLGDWVAERGGLPADHPLPGLAGFCHENGVLVKEHNLDYVPDATLMWHSRGLIDAVNVAPEFGVVETRALLAALDRIGRPDLRDRFIEIALASGKWKKWMLPDTDADDRQRAVIAGHYVYATPEVIALKEEANMVCKSLGWNLDAHLQAEIVVALERYLKVLGASAN